MGYDLHIVRTKDWTQAATAPVTKQDVDALISSDPELAWSTTDFVNMDDEAGGTTRYDMIAWRGEAFCWWYRDRIECSDPNEGQLMKLARMARALNAYAVGDDGEIYEIKKGFLGREKLVTTEG